jgi:hypothetical protein
MKTGMRAVMEKLAQQREAPAAPVRGFKCSANGCPLPATTDRGTCRHHHDADGATYQAVTRDLRRLEWLWELWGKLTTVENFNEWRNIAAEVMLKHDPEMAPTKDMSRELYLYRLHQYIDFRMGKRERKPDPLVPACKTTGYGGRRMDRLWMEES